MLSRLRLSALSTLGLCSVLAVACGGTTSSDTQSNASALDETNGGIAPGPEQPAFGDPQVQSLADLSSNFSDTLDEAAGSADAGTLSGSSYHVALLWGHLPPAHDADDTDTDPTVMNWTGSVSVDAGAIGIKKTLQFDLGDKIDPRTDPKVISFDSHTLPFVDGLFLRVVIPDGSPATLHFNTASLSTDVDLTQLPLKVGGVVRLADNVNGLAYIGYRDVPGCARGLLVGRWVKNQPRFGHLRGRVIDGEGSTIGHVRGIWGHSVKRDKDVFFAKYIGTGGDDHGLVLGTYGGGAFVGLWATRDETQIDVGTTAGFYSDGYDREDGRGVWIGRWSEKCSL